MSPLPPSAAVGILGGGQLGRMLAVAGGRMGLRVEVYDPDPAAPAAHMAARHHAAGWDDAEALTAFADGCDVVTYEWENVPTAALDIVERHAPIHPSRRAIEVSADRLEEKRFLQEIGLRVAPYAPAKGEKALRAVAAEIGLPGILKTRTMGYDGKGQARIDSEEDIPAAIEAMAGAPAILEGLVPFDREISVIAARSAGGAVAAYDPGENVHEGGILRTTRVPARIPRGLATDAVLAAGKILGALDYVGVMGVELFVTRGGLVVNEIAPRVHNSGHWTQGACVIDQFEQHMRAVAGWPLGDGTRFRDVEMENLIGADMDRVPALAADPAVQIHLYGKAETRTGRKMGHIIRPLA